MTTTNDKTQRLGLFTKLPEGKGEALALLTRFKRMGYVWHLDEDPRECIGMHFTVAEANFMSKMVQRLNELFEDEAPKRTDGSGLPYINGGAWHAAGLVNWNGNNEAILAKAAGLSQTHLAVVKPDGSIILMCDAERAHGLAGHHGYTVRQATLEEVSNVLRKAGVSQPDTSTIQVCVTGDGPVWRGTLAGFFEINADGIGEKEREEIIATVLAGKIYEGGGGAAGTFCVSQYPTPT